MCLLRGRLACLRDGRFIHCTMQVPWRHRCEGKQRVGSPPTHSPLLQHPCSQSPFQLLLSSGCLLLLIQISFLLSHAQPPPALQQAGLLIQPDHKPAIDENQPHAQDSIIL